jgi:hypothetical protein
MALVRRTSTCPFPVRDHFQFMSHYVLIHECVDVLFQWHYKVSIYSLSMSEAVLFYLV